MDLRVKDRMIYPDWTEEEIESWQKTIEDNRRQKNKDFLEACECLKKQKQ